jgi:phosphoribosylaminoimidazolecarboxamide formyltransferase / IMP cyclohydrolase
MTAEAAPAPALAGQGDALPGRLCVLVSGAGSNLKALHGAAGRGVLPGRIALVLADRACPAIDWAAEQGLATAIIDPADRPDQEAWDRALAAALAETAPDLVVLAGFMRWLGPAARGVVPAGRMLNVHPSLLPAFPGAHAVRDALAAGVRMTGVTVHVVDATLDGGPIVAQEAVAIRPEDDGASLAARLHQVEHRLLPRAAALALAGALRVQGGRVQIDEQAAAALPRTRRALISVSDKRGIADLGSGLVELGFELVSTGGTARALRDAGLPVTDVSAVTGADEMLDGRVKTLHPHIHGGLLADMRSDDHRAQLARRGIEPFELLVVNLYPFAEAAARPGITTDALIEEIDIGGPSLVRAAAKNHASVGVVTSADDYEVVLSELRDGQPLSDRTRRRLAAAAFRHTADYDARIARELPGRLGVAAEADAEPFPEALRLELERVQELRYGENPHQAAAVYRAVDGRFDGLFGTGIELIQGKPLSYNNILDAAAAAGIAVDLRPAGVAIVKHANPCGAAESGDPLEAWDRALAGDPVSAFGGVVAVNVPVDAALAERLISIFLEVVVAPAFDDTALQALAAKPNLRVVAEPRISAGATSGGLELRSAGGAVLVTEVDRAPDDPSTWQLATARAPTPSESADLDLAWRICRHVRSNAIVLVRDRAVVGVGAGQMSRVDSARLAVDKAGPERSVGAACASDAFFPFPDGVEVCLAAGVTAFVQPGGSQRDDEVVAAAERAGASMVLTGRRHFRH